LTNARSLAYVYLFEVIGIIFNTLICKSARVLCYRTLHYRCQRTAKMTYVVCLC